VSKLQSLLDLSHRLGLEPRKLAMLGEGNTSVRLTEETFLVKASGTSLSTLREEDAVECRFAPLLDLLDQEGLDDKAVDEALFASRVDAKAKKPSVEAVFHASLLALPGIEFVGHVHSVTANQILCSPRAEDFAKYRLFPDEIVCCGPRSVFVPYVDPGLALAKAIRDGVAEYVAAEDSNPRIILLKNHGVIAIGNSDKAVESALLMCAKAAEIFVGAAALGGPVFLTPENVARIGGRPDEHHRQKMLGI